MKIRRNKKDRSEKQTQSFQETVLLGDNEDSIQTFSKKPKERRSLGGKVEKTKTKTSRFSRFSLRNLLKKTSVAPDMNFTVATASPVMEFGIDQSLPYCTSYIENSGVEKDTRFMALDAGITPPKRGMLKKVNSSLVEQKMLGDFKTDDAGHTPKSKGKLKDVDRSKILKIMSTSGKENQSVSMAKKRQFLKQQPKKKKPLLRSKSDKSYDQVVPERAEASVNKSGLAHDDSHFAMLCIAKTAVATASPRIDLFSKTPRFAAVCEVTPMPANLNVSKSGKKRNSSALDATFVTRNAGSTPKRTKSVYQSRRTAYLHHDKMFGVTTKLDLSLNGTSSDEEIIACASELMAEDERGTVKRNTTKTDSTKKATKKRATHTSSEEYDGLLSDNLKNAAAGQTRRASHPQAASQEILIPSSSDEDIVACAADLMAHERVGTVRRNNKTTRKGIDTGTTFANNNSSKTESSKRNTKKRSRDALRDDLEGLLGQMPRAVKRRSSSRLAAKAAGREAGQAMGNISGMAHQTSLEEVCEERLV